MWKHEFCQLAWGIRLAISQKSYKGLRLRFYCSPENQGSYKENERLTDSESMLPLHLLGFAPGHKLLKFFMRTYNGCNGRTNPTKDPSSVPMDWAKPFKCCAIIRRKSSAIRFTISNVTTTSAWHCTTKRPSIPSRISNRIDFMNKISTKMNWTLLIKVIRFTFTDRDTGLYGIPFVPAERNDNKRALDAHSMICATW